MGGWLLLVQELYVLKFLRNRSVFPSPLLIAVNFRNLTAANPPSDPFARLRERIEHPFAIFLTIFSRMLRFAWRYAPIFHLLELGCFIGIRQLFLDIGELSHV